MEQLPENSVSVDISIKVMNTIVKYIYYGVRDVKKYQRLIDKIKSIRSFGNNGSKRLKYVLSELVSNSEGLIGSFKSSNVNNTRTNTNTRTTSSHSVLKNKEFLMNSLDIKKPSKIQHSNAKKDIANKNTWHDLESSDDEDDTEAAEAAEATTASEPATEATAAEVTSEATATEVTSEATATEVTSEATSAEATSAEATEATEATSAEATEATFTEVALVN
jgi:hypothetical protein